MRARRGKMGWTRNGHVRSNEKCSKPRTRFVANQRNPSISRRGSIRLSTSAFQRNVGGFDLSTIFAHAQTNEMVRVQKVRTWNVRCRGWLVECNDAVYRRASLRHTAGIDPRVRGRNGICRTVRVKKNDTLVIPSLQRRLNRAQSVFISIAR